MELSKEERETIIIFNEEDDQAEVFTYNRALASRLQRLSLKHPELCRLVKRNSFGAVSYRVPKRLVHISLPKTEDWKQAARKKALDFASNAEKMG